MIRLLIGTSNPGKLAELRGLLSDLPLELLAPSDLGRLPVIEEDSSTFEGNAIRKAVAFARWANTFALADDSGLEVDALGGEPGVCSAHFAGPGSTDRRNIDLLLDKLRTVPEEQRTARFRCVLAVACPHGNVLTVAGSCEGRIMLRPCGGEGFGYDPVFFSLALGKTFGEASAQEKRQASHRGAACMKLRELLPGWLAGRSCCGSHAQRTE